MKKGFTLAEVLITLGIIGIVAALTMPSLVTKYKEKETVVKLKKVYSILDNAMKMAINEQGVIADQWGLVYGEPQTFVDIISPYLKITKNCRISAGCFASGTYHSLTGQNAYFGDTATNFSKFILSNGTSVAVWMQPTSTFLGTLVIDLNGKKSPNTNGKDVFWFQILKDRIIPTGIEDDDTYTFDSCNLTKTGFGTGRGCTGWVIYNENMDYLHCNDLSWSGKTKCKNL
ncbi:MAG: type II secretion system GspH family protein [Heliobacteriaceae bacterium]|nr:type II secretion system GspH family protein [Heliobacteriaceae bacterium]